METKPTLSEAKKPEKYERFRAALKADPEAARVLKYFVPRCDFRKVFVQGAIFVCDSRRAFLNERREVHKATARDLRNEIRELERELEIRPEPIGVALLSRGSVRADHPADVRRALNDSAHANFFASIMPKKMRLHRAREQYHKARLLLNERRYGREDMSALFWIAEYLAWKGQVEVEGRDLVAILRAVYVALGIEGKHDPDPEYLLRKIRTFKRRNPAFVLAVVGNKPEPPENIL